ncbi:MAG TPA: hypothetical protein VFN67_37490 [Polyangiales bacterium]|nr:hypothetical protein [Polyangiales bacterium]
MLRLAALLCLVGCAAAVEADEDDDMSNYQIPYGSAGLVQLQGNASQLITLDNTNPTDVVWSPADRRAMDVEARVYFYQMQGLSESAHSLGCPKIRWGMRTAHGTSVIDEPAGNFPLQPGTFEAFGDTMPRVALPMLPGRGLHFRTTTRELTIRLQNTGYNGVGYYYRDMVGGPTFEENGVIYPTFPPVTMAVSFQPVEGLEVPLLPQSVYLPHSDAQDDWGNHVQLPAAAREWRIVTDTGHFGATYNEDPSGQPDEIQIKHVQGIRFLDPIGYQCAEHYPWEIDEDWQPLPPDAWAVFRAPTQPEFPAIVAHPIYLEFR